MPSSFLPDIFSSWFKMANIFLLCMLLFRIKAGKTTRDYLNSSSERRSLLSSNCLLASFLEAVKQAVDLCFPLADFKGCYFHFSQALMQKFQALGLQVAYRSDEETKQFLRTTAALAFVPIRFVRLAWQGIKASTPTHLPRIEEFVEYLESTWLIGNFPVQMWNVYENEDCRTNNHLEEWHKQLKCLVGKSHPAECWSKCSKKIGQIYHHGQKIKELEDRFEKIAPQVLMP